MTCVVYFHHKSEGLLVPRASNLKTVLLLCRCTTPGGRSTDFSINQKKLCTHTLAFIFNMPRTVYAYLDDSEADSSLLGRLFGPWTERKIKSE